MFCLDDEELLMDLFNSPEQELTTSKIPKSKKILKKTSKTSIKRNFTPKKDEIQRGIDLLFEGFKNKLSSAQKMEIIGFASKFFE